MHGQLGTMRVFLARRSVGWIWIAQHADEATQATLNVLYNAFPADEGEPHFFFPQTVTPMKPGKLYEVSARHSSSASATRDAKTIPVKLHSKGTPSAGEYIPRYKTWNQGYHQTELASGTSHHRVSPSLAERSVQNLAGRHFLKVLDKISHDRATSESSPETDILAAQPAEACAC